MNNSTNTRCIYLDDDEVNELHKEMRKARSIIMVQRGFTSEVEIMKSFPCLFIQLENELLTIKRSTEED